MRMMMSEGFTRLSERIDGLDTHMTSRDGDIRSLRDEFRSFKGEDVAFDPPEHQDGFGYTHILHGLVINPLKVDNYLMREIVGFDIRVDQTRRQGTTTSTSNYALKHSSSIPQAHKERTALIPKIVTPQYG
ncbi:hypothetical protein PIB30_087347 [Stylosanthes scabra]|uniref:Uncharacterized protein n=1 Tax=Stylosanthes scabra TaxID=79078 RepID=A0ABU6VWK1_9FABA|nr:hypothetical protein [Stylosanthes scabra]